MNHQKFVTAAACLGAATCAVFAMSGSSRAAPVPLPDPGIPGYHFPESERVLMKWINTGKSAHIHRHGWGLWTSLTMPSGQAEFGMPNVPVYLTWLTPAEIAALPPVGAALPERKFRLEAPRQHAHGARLAQATAPAGTAAPGAASVATSPASSTGPDTEIAVTMGYSPAAQAWAQKNNLFSMKALQAIYDAGSGDIRSIPTFPTSSVTTKPTYKVITASKLRDGHIYTLAAWPGTPPVVTPSITENGFPETAWPGCVYVDTRNTGRSVARGTDPGCKAGPQAGNTYGLGDFVNFPVTAANLQSFENLVGSPLVVGDVVLLMAMHVTSREIEAWTWQTFFWTPDPAKPPLPSSPAIAAARPAALKGAAAHYAMSIGYQMVSPNQPVVGGRSVGQPVVAYNPYLEAVFKKSDFGAPPVNPGIRAPGQKKPYMATVGIQSNCMTCHSTATVASANSGLTQPLPYLTDFYLSRRDPAFKGYLQLDFLWSIQGTAK